MCSCGVSAALWSITVLFTPVGYTPLKGPYGDVPLDWVWFFSSLVLTGYIISCESVLIKKQSIACTTDLVCSQADQRNCLGHHDVTCDMWCQTFTVFRDTCSRLYSRSWKNAAWNIGVCTLWSQNVNIWQERWIEINYHVVSAFTSMFYFELLETQRHCWPYIGWEFTFWS